MKIKISEILDQEIIQKIKLLKDIFGWQELSIYNQKGNLIVYEKNIN